MAITAREVVFYIRAENQASRAFKQVARDVGGLRNLKNVQQAASRANEAALARVAKAEAAITKNRLAYNKALQESAILQRRADAALLPKNSVAVKAAQQRIASNAESLALARTEANKMQRLASKGKASGGFTAEEIATRAGVAQDRVTRLNSQTGILNRTLKETRLNAEQTYNAIKAGAVEGAAAVETLKAEHLQLLKVQDEVRLAAAAEAAQFKRLEASIPLERLGRLATLAQRVGRVFQITGIVVGASLAAMAHSAAAFETQVTLAATQSTVKGRNSTQQVLNNAKFLQNQITKLVATGKVTSPFADQTNSTYQIFSSVSLKGNQNQQLKEGISLLKQFNRVATANFGMVDLNTVTKAGIVLMNRFHVSVEQMPAALNRMQAAVRFGAMNMSQFISGFNQVAPAFNAAGYSFDQMAGTMAFISRKFPSVAIGFTGLARLTETFANPKILAGLKAQGIAITDTTGHLLPLDEIVTKILTKWPKLAKGGVDLQNFFKNIGGLQSTVQARRVFVSIAQDLPGYRKMLHDVTGDNNELNKSWQAMQKSPQVRWTEFTLKLKALAYEIGVYVIPAFTELGKPIGRLVQWFDGLSPHTKKLVAEFALFGSVGALAIGTILAVAGAVSHLYIAFKLMRLGGGLRAALFGTEAAGAAGGVGVLAGEAGSALVPVAALAGALVALGVILYKDPHLLKQVSNAMGGLSGVMKGLIILIGGFTLVKVIGSLAALGGEAGAAALLVGKLRLGLLAIVAIGAITIPIVENISRKFNDPSGSTNNAHGQVVAGQRVTKNDKGVWGFLQNAQNTSLYELDKHLFGDTSSQARDAVMGVNSMGAALLPSKVNFNVPTNQIRKRLAALALATTNAKGNPNDLGSLITPKTQLKLYNLAESGQIAEFEKEYNNALQKAYKHIRKNIKGIVNGLGDALQQPFKHAQAVKVHTVKMEALLPQLQAVAALQAAYSKAPLNEKAHDAFFKALAALNKKYADKMTQDYISNYLSAVESADKKSLTKRADLQKKAFKAATEEIKTATAGIKSIYDNFLSQNQSNFGTLFSGPFESGPRQQTLAQWGFKINSADALKDVKSSLFQFNRFNSDLTALAKRGGPKTLIDQIQQMGPVAGKDGVKALMHLSPAQWQEYISTWNRGQAAIKRTTMAQLKSQLKLYQSHGRAIALAIIKGIKSEDQGLNDELQNVILNMFPGLAKQGRLKPGKVTAVTAPSIVNNKSGSSSNTTASEKHVHYHVTTDDPKKTMTELKHLNFRFNAGW